jgi:APA family basic amino acid/polyamine antiporter
VTSRSEGSREGKLLQVLGTAFGLAVIVGNTIGVGILRNPGDIATHLPSIPWFMGVWVGGGIYALLGAMTLAELGTMIPQSGGQYVFTRRALGEYPGFVIGWSDWVSSCASLAAVTIPMGEYSDVLFPFLKGHSALVAVVIVVSLALIQWRGIRAGDVTQQITSGLKTLVLLGLAGICLFATPAVPATAVPAAVALSFIPTAGAVVLSLQAVIYTYDGWNGMLYFSGEVKNVGRDIPRAMAGGVLLVIAIYLLLNVAFLRVLTLPRMAGQNLVAATAAQAIFGPAGDRVVRVVILVSLLSAANAILLLTSRIPYAMSQDGMLGKALSRVNAGGTPTVSLLFSSLSAIGLILTGTFEQVLALAALFFVINYTASFISVIVLRRRDPTAPRPYRALGYPWVTWFLVLGSLAFLSGDVLSDTRNALWSLGLLAVSWPAFRLVGGGSRKQ